MADYAAIFADHEISRDEIVAELKKRGWQVVSKQIEHYDHIREDVRVWLLFGWKRLRHPDWPCQGCVRIVSEAGKNDRIMYFYFARSPWYVVAYHQASNWGLLMVAKLISLFRKK